MSVFPDENYDEINCNFDKDEPTYNELHGINCQLTDDDEEENYEENFEDEEEDDEDVNEDEFDDEEEDE